MHLEQVRELEEGHPVRRRFFFLPAILERVAQTPFVAGAGDRVDDHFLFEGDRVDFADRVEVIAGEGANDCAFHAEDDHEEATVGEGAVLFEATEPGDLLDRGGLAEPRLVIAENRPDREFAARVEQVADHLTVARLEDVERLDLTGEEHDVGEREERHDLPLRGRSFLRLPFLVVEQWFSLFTHSSMIARRRCGRAHSFAPTISARSRIGAIPGNRDGGVMTTEPIFETEQLRCRRWRPDDLEPIFTVYSDPEGARFVGDGTPITREQCEQWLEVTAKNYERYGYGMFALEELSSGDVIGFCGLVHPGGQPETEIKYAFLRSHWGQGLASEVVPRLLAYGAKEHGLAMIIATVADGNLASLRVLAKAGMTLVRTIPSEDGSITQVHEWRASSV